MKLAFVTRFDVHDRQVRSGVPYSIFHALERGGHQVVWVRPEYNLWERIRWTLFRAARKICRLFRYEIPELNPWLARIQSAAVDRKLSSLSGIDAVVGTNFDEFAFIQTKLPVFVRTDTIFPSPVGYTHTPPKRYIRWHGRCERLALGNITGVFAASQWMVEEACKYYPKAIADKFVFVPTGANLDDAMIEYRPRDYAPGRSLNMLFVGYDIRKKGISYAWEAMRALNDRYRQPAVLTVLGGRPSDDMLRDSDVHYIGILDKNRPDEYARFYQQFRDADLFIFPTRAEYHGIVNCEAAAYGLPIFATRTGGVPSYARDGINGLTFPLSASGADFAEVIWQALNDGTMRQFSRASRQLYESEFNWDAWVRTVSPIIRQHIQRQ